MLHILDRITRGEGKTERPRPCWRSWPSCSPRPSLCALGKTAANPVLSTLRYFRDEYEAHIARQALPGGGVQGAVPVPDRRRDLHGLRLCRKNCPVECITGERKKPHVIDQAGLHQVRHLLREVPASGPS